MSSEQCNYGQRATLTPWLIDCLLGAPDGVEISVLASTVRVPPGVVERVFKYFEFRGFARHVDRRWFSTPVLAGMPLIEVKA